MARTGSGGLGEDPRAEAVTDSDALKRLFSRENLEAEYRSLADLEPDSLRREFLKTKSVIEAILKHLVSLKSARSTDVATWQVAGGFITATIHDSALISVIIEQEFAGLGLIGECGRLLFRQAAMRFQELHRDIGEFRGRPEFVSVTQFPAYWILLQDIERLENSSFLGPIDLKDRPRVSDKDSRGKTCWLRWLLFEWSDRLRWADWNLSLESYQRARGVEDSIDRHTGRRSTDEWPVSASNILLANRQYLHAEQAGIRGLLFELFPDLVSDLSTDFGCLQRVTDEDIADRVSRFARIALAIKDRLGSELVQYVTLDEMSALAGESKKTYERLLKTEILPQPDIEGGGGKSHQWKWYTIRLWLQRQTGREFPENLPHKRY